MRYREELNGGFFSAIQYAVADRGGLVGEKAEGLTAFEHGAPVTARTMFDLASLTKALFTAPACHLLFDRGLVRPDDTLDRFFPGQRPVPLLRLLNHTSGYPAYLEFFRDAAAKRYDDRRAAVLARIAALGDIEPPVYSDLNFTLLGFVLEKVAGEPLDTVWGRLLDDLNFPQGDIVFAKRPLLKQHTAATMFSKERGRLCHGEVEDENCWYLGSVAGHAGLFGSAGSVASYLMRLLDRPWFRSALDRLGGAGFDRPQGLDSHYGRTAHARTVGHLGFTGTAFLLDPEKGRAAVVLTNRTHPDPDKEQWRDRIKTVRRELFEVLLPV
ncbi:MAG TPA: serine hydrolase domain-containing protein [bacterium]|nr:serine hydrolase domain-containing protein [bacterium]